MCFKVWWSHSKGLYGYFAGDLDAGCDGSEVPCPLYYNRSGMHTELSKPSGPSCLICGLWAARPPGQVWMHLYPETGGSILFFFPSVSVCKKLLACLDCFITDIEYCLLHEFWGSSRGIDLRILMLSLNGPWGSVLLKDFCQHSPCIGRFWPSQC